MKHQLARLSALFTLLPVLALSSCGRNTAASPSPSPSLSPSASASAEPSPSPSAWHSGVKTDYSGLTAYKPPEENYTRMTDAPMPSLIPSNNYGKLLPYVGEISYGSDFQNPIRTYGLMTAYSTLVTDPVYAAVYQAYSYTSAADTPLPVYFLQKISDRIDVNSPENSVECAACALDGSWCTSFDYKSIYFDDKVMVLIRDDASNDFDVMDYGGKLLYNSKSLEFYSLMPARSASSFGYSCGEGYFSLGLTNGKTVFFDALTGKATYLDFDGARSFSEGRAVVQKGGLYGYIDKDFNVVIQPQFIYADNFTGGKAAVQLPDKSFALIGTDGNILLKNDGQISRWDNKTFGLYHDNKSTEFYDGDLNPIKAPAGAPLNPMNDGWFWYKSDGGVTIFKGGESHTLPGVDGAGYTRGGLVTVYTSGNNWQEGLMTLDGKTVRPLARDQYFAIDQSTADGKIYVIVSKDAETSSSYAILDQTGKTILSGSGDASYDTANNLFVASGELSYSLFDTSGKNIFSISLLKYVPD